MAEHQDEDQGAGEKGRDFIAAGDGHGPGDQEGQAEAGRGPEQRMRAVGIPEPGGCEFFRQEDHDAAQKHKQRGPGEPVAFPDPVRDAHPYVPDGQDHDIADRGRESPGNGFSACEEKERRQAGDERRKPVLRNVDADAGIEGLPYVELPRCHGRELGPGSGLPEEEGEERVRAQPAQKHAEGFGTAAADPGKDYGTCGHEHEGLLAESGAGHEDASQDGPARGREEDAGSCEKDAVSSVPGHAGETVDAEDEARSGEKRQGNAELLKTEDLRKVARREPGGRQHGAEEAGLAGEHFDAVGRELHPEGVPEKGQGRFDVEEIPVRELSFQNAPGEAVKIAEVRGVHAHGNVQEEIGQGHGQGDEPGSRAYCLWGDRSRPGECGGCCHRREMQKRNIPVR